MVVIELIILLERKKTAKKKRFFVLYDLMELIADHSPSSMQAPVALWVGHTARVMHSPEAGQEAPSQPGGGSGGGGSDCRNDRSGAFRCL